MKTSSIGNAAPMGGCRNNGRILRVCRHRRAVGSDADGLAVGIEHQQVAVAESEHDHAAIVPQWGAKAVSAERLRPDGGATESGGFPPKWFPDWFPNQNFARFFAWASYGKPCQS